MFGCVGSVGSVGCVGSVGSAGFVDGGNAEVGSAEVGAVGEAVGALASVDIEGLDGERAQELLVELRRVRARLAAVEARLLARADSERAWAGAGYLSAAGWLADSDHVPLDGARGELRLARRLRTMPATAAALAAGDITGAHAARLAGLNAPDTAQAFAEAETFLVDQARSMRWCEFTKAAGYWLRQARADRDPDPDKADRDHRHLHLHDGLRGTGLLTGELTPTAKATVRSALERIERELFDADWAAARAAHGDTATVAHLARTPAQRRHDALLEMATRATTAPAHGKRPRPLLSILVGEASLARVLELADGTLVSPATTADLLDEAVIERIVFDSPSRIIDIGHQRRFVGAARRAVEVLHRTCTGPGCHTPATRCEIDHILPWAHGGPTHPDNGRPNCPAHHRQHTRPKPPNPPTPTPPHPTPSVADSPATPTSTSSAPGRDRVLRDPTWSG